MCEILKSFLESQTFGIILGSILTAGFTLFIEWRKSVRDEKAHLKEKRENIYSNILDIFYKSRQDMHKGHSAESDLSFLLEAFYPNINIYASKKVKDIYNQVMHTTENKENILIE